LFSRSILTETLAQLLSGCAASFQVRVFTADWMHFEIGLLHVKAAVCNRCKDGGSVIGSGVALGEAFFASGDVLYQHAILET
jgi:hypothetical protein